VWYWPFLPHFAHAIRTSGKGNSPNVQAPFAIVKTPQVNHLPTLLLVEATNEWLTNSPTV
jgi:hypothetical protein